MEILIKRLNEQAKLPVYGREAGPGIDLYALNETTVNPREKVVVSTGVAMAMPVGYVGLIFNKHSMVTNEEVKVVASLVDSGYREEIIVELMNTGENPQTYAAGEQIAQLLVQKIHHAHLIEAEDLSAPSQE